MIFMGYEWYLMRYVVNTMIFGRVRKYKIGHFHAENYDNPTDLEVRYIQTTPSEFLRFSEIERS